MSIGTITAGLALTMVCAIASLPAMAASKSRQPPPPSEAPFIPQSNAQVLQQVPKRDTPKLKKIYALQHKLKAHPHSLKTALALAQAYVAFGRGRGDAHFAGYAEATIAPWMAKNPPPAKVLVMHATILQFLHKFKAAEAELQQALKRNPKDGQAWLTLAFVQMIQGDFDSANKACVQTANYSGNMIGIACTAALRSFTGRAQQANKLLAFVRGGGPKIPAGIKAWIESLLAETSERLGRAKQAERYYLKALHYTPNDNFLLVNYADLLLDKGQPRKVIKLLRDHLYSDTAFLRYALAKQAIDSSDVARYTWIMRARFAALEARGSTIYQREHSRFVLHLEHDPARALALAQRNWGAQRAPWDIRVYLEAALAAGKPAAAKPALALLDKYHLQDPIIDRLAKKVRTKINQRGS